MAFLDLFRKKNPTEVGNTPDEYQVGQMSGIPITILTDTNTYDMNLYSQVRKFIAKEFSKTQVILPRKMTNKSSVEYLLNLKPNEEETIETLKYNFAYWMLMRGYVYYRVVLSKNNVVTALEIVSNLPEITDEMTKAEVDEIQSFTQFKAPQCKKVLNSTLLTEYENSIKDMTKPERDTLLKYHARLNKGLGGTGGVNGNSGAPMNNKMDLNSFSKVKEVEPIDMAKEESIQNKIKKDKEGTEEQLRKDIQGVMNLINLNSELREEKGAIIETKNETIESIAGNRTVRPEILEQYKELVYNDLGVNPKILTGDYTEEEYRSFAYNQLQSLIDAFESLLNVALMNRKDFSTKNCIKLEVDFGKIVTMSTLSGMVQKEIYYGISTANEARVRIGKEPVGLNGDILMTNANQRPVEQLRAEFEEKFGKKITGERMDEKNQIIIDEDEE